jgi:pimeloyl-ACP methyl ester carboxylesterase
VITALSDGRLLAEKFGSGLVNVVALHGWGRSGKDFTGILDGQNGWAIHLPGFGITPPPPTAWSSQQYADEVVAALVGHPPVFLVGHSFGGRVAVRLAARHPELVRGIVLTGTPLLRLTEAPKVSLSYRIVRGLARKRFLPASILEAQRARRGSADYRASQGVMRDTLVTVIGEDYREDLAKIEVPVRMVWGEFDDAAPVNAGLAASRLMVNAQFRTVPGAGHLLDAELSAAVRDELLGLIAECDA